MARALGLDHHVHDKNAGRLEHDVRHEKSVDTGSGVKNITRPYKPEGRIAISKVCLLKPRTMTLVRHNASNKAWEWGNA